MKKYFFYTLFLVTWVSSCSSIKDNELDGNKDKLNANKKKLNDVKVMKLVDKHIVVLINKNKEYVQISAEFAIE